MKKVPCFILCALAAAVTVAASYASCYSQFWQPACIQAGTCYGQCTPQGCSQSTCLIATQTGYELGQFNTYPSSTSGWQSRGWDGHSYNTCVVSACKIWNNCTQQYEYSPINGCSCDTRVVAYTPSEPSGCQ